MYFYVRHFLFCTLISIELFVAIYFLPLFGIIVSARTFFRMRNKFTETQKSRIRSCKLVLEHRCLCLHACSWKLDRSIVCVCRSDEESDEEEDPVTKKMVSIRTVSTIPWRSTTASNLMHGQPLTGDTTHENGNTVSYQVNSIRSLNLINIFTVELCQ